MVPRLSLVSVAIAAFLGACVSRDAPAPDNVLVAAKVATPPVLDATRETLPGLLPGQSRLRSPTV